MNSNRSSCRIVADARDYCVVGFKYRDYRLPERIAVLFDHDRDMRILDVLAASGYRDHERTDSLGRYFRRIRAVSASNDQITAWYDANRSSLSRDRTPRIERPTVSC